MERKYNVAVAGTGYVGLSIATFSNSTLQIDNTKMGISN